MSPQTLQTNATRPPRKPRPHPPRLPRLPYLPSPIDLTVYTPSVPCLHCTLVSSSPRCSLLNLLNHRDHRDHKRRPKNTPPPWYMYINKPDIPLPVPGLQAKCSRCVKDGIEWCVLREMDGAPNGAPTGARAWVPVVGPGRSREGEVVFDGDSMGRMVGKKETGEVSVTKELGVGRGHGGGNDEKISSDSLVSRARRIGRVENPDDSVDEDVDGSLAPRKFKRTVKSGKSTKFSKASPVVTRINSTSPDIAGYDADSDSTDNDSNPDPDGSDSDAKSNVSSKTSFSKRSIKSTNSTTSPPFLTPSSPPVKHPVKQHPESPPPPPSSPPEQISSDYMRKEERSWIWKPKGWEEALGKEKVKIRKKFNREEWMGHPLSAAVTAVEVSKWDVKDLVAYGRGGLKRFFTREIPFIAYVRASGLEGREEDLLHIVRTQILDVMNSYLFDPNTRKKEALTAVGGYLPLESRFGGFLTQEDMQGNFALPTWRKRGLEFLGEDMVEMRRRKKKEAIERERRKQEKRELELMLERWKREGGGCEEGGGETEGKEKENEQKNEVQTSDESKTLTPNNANTTKPPDSPPGLSPDQDLYTSDPDPELPPSTPTEYFSRRHTRLHNFWTKEAQPTDFEFAKVIRKNTFRKWRGERSGREGYKSWWLSSASNDENENEWENVTGGKNISEWLTSQRSSLGQGQGQRGTGTGRLPVPVPVTRAAGGRRRKLTRQQLAEFDYTEDEEEEDEEEWRPPLADELEILTDASDDEDILRFLGDDCDDDDDDVGDEGEGVGSEEEDGDEHKDEDEDSYPLVDHVRESMMNKC